MSDGRKYPKLIIGGRDITLRQKPGAKPVEERKSIVSNRVTMAFRDGTAHRLESELETGAMELFNANQNVVAIRTQFGPIPFRREGKNREHYADICVDFRNGCRNLYAVRNEANIGDLKIELELIRTQTLRQYAHGLHLLTEAQITKPEIYRAREMARATKLRNSEKTEWVTDALRALGGSAVIFDLATYLGTKLVFAELWTAIWALFHDGLIRHVHPNPAAAVITRLSRIRIVKENADV